MLARLEATWPFVLLDVTFSCIRDCKFNTNIVKETNRLLDQINPQQRCFWIAPTRVSSKYKKKIEKTEAAIKEAINKHSSPCIIIKTYKDLATQKDCSKFNAPDGLHHSSCGSLLWAELAIEKICDSLYKKRN